MSDQKQSSAQPSTYGELAALSAEGDRAASNLLDMLDAGTRYAEGRRLAAEYRAHARSIADESNNGSQL